MNAAATTTPNGHDMTEPLVTTWLWETPSYAQTRAVDVTCQSAGRSWFPKSIKPWLLSPFKWSQDRFLKSKSNVLFQGYFRTVWIILYAEWFWWWYAFWKQLIRDLRANLSSKRQIRKSLCVSSSHFFFPFSLGFCFAKVWFSLSLVCFFQTEQEKKNMFKLKIFIL